MCSILSLLHVERVVHVVGANWRLVSSALVLLEAYLDVHVFKVWINRYSLDCDLVNVLGLGVKYLGDVTLDLFSF